VNVMNEVAVIGLGSMGSTIARLLIESGRRVTVWNRSPEKADALTKRGAILAQSVEAAVRASPFILMCVYDYQAANAILEAPGVAAALQNWASPDIPHLNEGGYPLARSIDSN
jgi:3-hydroxyisobutyrate dehydrogenase-like beta-hydroxyacid dehydrogenase